MKLRSINVLFVDDNVQNLEEAKHFCPEIMTVLPEELVSLFEEAKSADQKDLNHKRLKQYQLLEKKEASRSEYQSNTEFLMQ